MLIVKRRNILIAVAIISAILLIVLACFISITRYQDYHPEPGTLIVDGEIIGDSEAYFGRKKAWVPLTPILEAYGYTFEKTSDALVVITKGSYIYHLNLTEMSLFLIESPEYAEGEEIPHVNILTPPPGGKYKNHPIIRKDNEIWLDNVTMLGVLGSLRERPQCVINCKEHRIEFRCREDEDVSSVVTKDHWYTETNCPRKILSPRPNVYRPLIPLKTSDS